MTRSERSSRWLMQNRTGRRYAKQLPGFKMVLNQKTGETELRMNRKERRRRASLKRRGKLI